MFDRDRKGDKGFDDAPDTRAAMPPRSTPPQGARSGSGDVAVIGRSIQINGDVRGDEDLRIEGDITGTVQLKNANLTIGREGRVKADVYAKSITVDGTTEGDLYATERVHVAANANVRGNITAPRVGIEEGCRFKGSIEMDQEEVDKALARVNMSKAGGAPAKASEARPAQPGSVKGAATN
ncbi:MAG TPA: polymer-forming cytoskeletal protein [Woeseiaceae bacterium]|nr:polymer-forming cytoskeletal protein [Woeseiaceae bacterium]